MPEITNENKELKEKKVTVAKKSTKTSSTSAAKKSSTKTAKTTAKSTKTSSKEVGSSKKVAEEKPKTKVVKKVKKTVEPKTETKKETTKKAATKKVEKVAESKAKVTTKKSEEKPKTKVVKKVKKVKKEVVKEEKVKVDTKPENKKEEKVKEETIIQKIKNFLAKIIAMQEEARLEEEAKQLAKKDSKSVAKPVEQEKVSYMLEYYDLPYRYNETTVKILAQTPKKLFVYWDISDDDRQKYIKAFGEKFFEDTYPVLLVHNEDMNYTFEVAINDFANSWYLDINDPKSSYSIELGRKFRTKSQIVNIARTEETKDIILHNDYVPIIKSNVLEVPNDHILFEKVQTRVLYRNVKTNKETFVDIENNEFTKNMGHIYNIYEIYKEIYKNEIDDESLFDLLNPSSMSSSAFK